MIATIATWIEAVGIAFGLATVAGMCGAAFTFGCAVVCRGLSWSPININVTIERDEY